MIHIILFNHSFGDACSRCNRLKPRPKFASKLTHPDVCGIFGSLFDPFFGSFFGSFFGAFFGTFFGSFFGRFFLAQFWPSGRLPDGVRTASGPAPKTASKMPKKEPKKGAKTTPYFTTLCGPFCGTFFLHLFWPLFWIIFWTIFHEKSSVRKARKTAVRKPSGRTTFGDGFNW
jgi:hypothetical protein